MTIITIYMQLTRNRGNTQTALSPISLIFGTEHQRDVDSAEFMEVSQSRYAAHRDLFARGHALYPSEKINALRRTAAHYARCKNDVTHVARCCLPIIQSARAKRARGIEG
ncbi:hypothetical protein PUN28_015685 [Cardiocondyla obscurior]|uniref:Uncharacterized protein n=1 Tax=Cardiocondyla obscurior TaxID=286306 RepID=A0AAW2EU94_9HYME